MKLLLGPENLTTELDFKVADAGDGIGVFVSGGLDSAALLCLILTELQITNKLIPNIVSCFTVKKSDGSTFYATRIIKKISEHFGYSILHHNDLNNDLDAFNQGRVGRTPIVESMSLHPIKVFYLAGNRMAPPDIVTFKHKLAVQYYDRSDVTAFYKTPFLNLHKPQILDIFYKINCEHIIPYTHTCANHNIRVCNDCYSCDERNWAFSLLDKIDPGTLLSESERILVANCSQF